MKLRPKRKLPPPPPQCALCGAKLNPFGALCRLCRQKVQFENHDERRTTDYIAGPFEPSDEPY